MVGVCGIGSEYVKNTHLQTASQGFYELYSEPESLDGEQKVPDISSRQFQIGLPCALEVPTENDRVSGGANFTPGINDILASDTESENFELHSKELKAAEETAYRQMIIDQYDGLMEDEMSTKLQQGRENVNRYKERMTHHNQEILKHCREADLGSRGPSDETMLDSPDYPVAPIGLGIGIMPVPRTPVLDDDDMFVSDSELDSDYDGHRSPLEKRFYLNKSLWGYESEEDVSRLASEPVPEATRGHGHTKSNTHSFNSSCMSAESAVQTDNTSFHMAEEPLPMLRRTRSQHNLFERREAYVNDNIDHEAEGSPIPSVCTPQVSTFAESLDQPSDDTGTFLNRKLEQKEAKNTIGTHSMSSVKDLVDRVEQSSPEANIGTVASATRKVSSGIQDLVNRVQSVQPETEQKSSVKDFKPAKVSVKNLASSMEAGLNETKESSVKQLPATSKTSPECTPDAPQTKNKIVSQPDLQLKTDLAPRPTPSPVAPSPKLLFQSKFQSRLNRSPSDHAHLGLEKTEKPRTRKQLSSNMETEKVESNRVDKEIQQLADDVKSIGSENFEFETKHNDDSPAEVNHNGNPITETEENVEVDTPNAETLGAGTGEIKDTTTEATEKSGKNENTLEDEGIEIPPALSHHGEIDDEPSLVSHHSENQKDGREGSSGLKPKDDELSSYSHVDKGSSDDVALSDASERETIGFQEVDPNIEEFVEQDNIVEPETLARTATNDILVKKSSNGEDIPPRSPARALHFEFPAGSGVEGQSNPTPSKAMDHPTLPPRDVLDDGDDDEHPPLPPRHHADNKDHPLLPPRGDHPPLPPRDDHPLLPSEDEHPPLPPRHHQSTMDATPAIPPRADLGEPVTPSKSLERPNLTIRNNSSRESLPSRHMVHKVHAVPPPLEDELKKPELQDFFNRKPSPSRGVSSWFKKSSPQDYDLALSRYNQTKHQYMATDAQTKEAMADGANELKSHYSEFLESMEEKELVQVDWPFWTKVINAYPDVVVNNSDKLEAQIALGIPQQIRGIVWQLVSRSKSAQWDVKYTELLPQESVHEKLIKRDINRTNFIPENRQEDLFNVLKVYSLYDPEVGYTQGMAFIVTPLLLETESEPEAFGLLVQLMSSYGLRKFFVKEMPGLHLKLYQFDRILEENSPALFNHMMKQGARSSMYATQWFITFFAYKFPLDFVLRIFDMVFVEGLEVILKFALVLVLKSQETLMSLNFDQLLDYLKEQLFTQISIDDLVNEAVKLSILPITLKRYEQEYDEIHQMEQMREQEFEYMRIKNRELHNEVKKLEHDYTTLKKDHSEITTQLIDGRLKIKTLEDENMDLRKEISELHNQVAEEIRKQSLPNPDNDLPTDLKLDLEQTMARNLEVMNRNQELEEMVLRMQKELDRLHSQQIQPAANNKALGKGWFFTK